jgi:hypothetical protein
MFIGFSQAFSLFPAPSFFCCIDSRKNNFTVLSFGDAVLGLSPPFKPFEMNYLKAYIEAKKIPRFDSSASQEESGIKLSRNTADRLNCFLAGHADLMAKPQAW